MVDELHLVCFASIRVDVLLEESAVDDHGCFIKLGETFRLCAGTSEDLEGGVILRVGISINDLKRILSDRLKDFALVKGVIDMEVLLLV